VNSKNRCAEPSTGFKALRSRLAAADLPDCLYPFFPSWASRTLAIHFLMGQPVFAWVIPTTREEKYDLAAPIKDQGNRVTKNSLTGV
jgi:hypothetical protein